MSEDSKPPVDPALSASRCSISEAWADKVWQSLYEIRKRARRQDFEPDKNTGLSFLESIIGAMDLVSGVREFMADVDRLNAMDGVSLRWVVKDGRNGPDIGEPAPIRTAMDQAIQYFENKK